jgi:acetyl esterase/lipase
MQKNTKILLLVLGILVVFLMLVGLIRNARNNNGNFQDGTVPTVNFNIKYGEYPKQMFDFYAPTSGQNSDSLIIIIHGGAWILGDKSQFSSHSKFFAGKGFSVVNMNYRLAPTWKYDTQLRDITNLINFVDSNRERFKLNPGYKIILVGHSAGAHLSDLYGVRESYYGGSKNIDSVISLAGPTDIPVYNPTGELDRALNAFIGDATKEEISPSRNVPQNEKTRFLLIIGSDDPLVPENQVTIFENALKEKNAYVEILIVPGRNHNSIEDRIPNNDEVAQKILNFINE